MAHQMCSYANFGYSPDLQVESVCCKLFFNRGPVAQLVEHQPCKLGVQSSNLCRSTTISRAIYFHLYSLICIIPVALFPLSSFHYLVSALATLQLLTQIRCSLFSKFFVAHQDLGYRLSTSKEPGMTATSSPALGVTGADALD